MAGILFPLGAALFWSIAVILFRKSGDEMSPLSLNLFCCLVALVLFIPTLLVMNIPFFPECPSSDWWILGLSGILGITLADSLFFASLGRLGAGLSSIVSCLNLPTIILLSYLFLGEHLTAKGLIGGALVLSAMIISSLHGRDFAVRKKDIVIGMIQGVLSVLAVAIGIIVVKDVLIRSDIVWATSVRLFIAFLGMVLMVILHPQRRKLFNEMRPSRTWMWAITASIMGHYLGLICWLAGMKYTLVSLAAILNQLSVILIFILAAVFLKEKITVHRSIAITLAKIGAIVTVYN